MKKLFMKELREEFGVAVIGLAVSTVLLTGFYKDWSRTGYISAAQPLLSLELRVGAVWFCAIFGIMLGWLQIRAEKHPDLWAFLIHRPMTRTTILGTKIAAGLCLYALAAGLPLLGFIAVVLIPGHVAAPFEWPMTFPLTAVFLLGIVCYLAGMLTGLRKAHWYGSRGFGLGLAIFAGWGVFAAQESWQALLVLLATGGILAAAVWGSFQSGGYYRNQPMPGKLALTLACVAATGLVVGVWAGGLINLLAPESSRYPWAGYTMTKDGIVYKEIHPDIGTPEIVDLNGKPLLDDKTGQRMKLKEFDPHRAVIWPVHPRFSRQEWNNWWHPRYPDNGRFFTPSMGTTSTLWYLTHDGHVVSYDAITRLHTATLEAGGNSTSGAEAGLILAAFYRNFASNEAEQRLVLISATTVYLADLENRALKPISLKPIFTVTDDDRIGGYFYPNDPAWHGMLVVTRKSVKLLDFDGRVEWSIPCQPSYPAYSQINVCLLEPTNRFAVEFYPDYQANGQSGWKLPVRIEWFTAGEGISKSLDLPHLPQPRRTGSYLREALVSLLMPPPFLVKAAFWDDSNRHWDSLCLIPAILCATAGWLIGRRYSFPARAQLGWGVFHLLCGIPGLLAFLSVQEWPARETCPRCKKLRVVDRERCPHCGADFAPPEKNGMEIFEPLAAD
jgi:hypothetical protein